MLCHVVNDAHTNFGGRVALSKAQCKELNSKEKTVYSESLENKLGNVGKVQLECKSMSKVISTDLLFLIGILYRQILATDLLNYR